MKINLPPRPAVLLGLFSLPLILSVWSPAAIAVGSDPPIKTLPSASVPGVAENGEVMASRFLVQASFGPTSELIAEVAALGPEAWIDAQLQVPATYHEAITNDIIADLIPPLDQMEGLGEEELELVVRSARQIYFPSRRFAWWEAAMDGPDALRQRVAFALSEILVVSDHVPELGRQPLGLASYYDVLVEHALGNYRDLLLDVTLHPVMGLFLSHINNPKSDPSAGTFADENYAREAMQLFSIGLWELNPNGIPKLDGSGETIPTYSNAAITEFARIYTGLGPGGTRGRFGVVNRRTDFTTPMLMYQEHHDTGQKTLLNGVVVPDGQSGMEDIEAAIDNLFYHPNVGPFIGRRLIQRLVTSNPSPDYLGRISAVFADNGQGIRGDLGAVVRAVLLDEEARELRDDPGFGHLQEPWLRYVGLLRAFGASSPSGRYLNVGEAAELSLHQHPLSAPSVFNFFLPDFRPNGPIAAAGLAAPEFQLTNTSSVVSLANFLNRVVMEGEVAQIPLRGLLCFAAINACIAAASCEDDRCLRDKIRDAIDSPAGQKVRSYILQLDLQEEIAIADNVPALVSRLDLLVAQGSLSEATRTALIDALSGVAELESRVRLGIYLTALSPSAAVVN